MSLERRFEEYLVRKGYRLETPGGRPSTARDYVGRVTKVCQWEGCSWESLSGNIDAVIAAYDTGGEKEALGMKSHRAVINALKRFGEMVGEEVRQGD